MEAGTEEPAAQPDASLCASCLHCRVIRSDRGSVFYQCRRAFSDASFPKYPRLPVRICRGYEQPHSHQMPGSSR